MPIDKAMRSGSIAQEDAEIAAILSAQQPMWL
jgi:hypothetical protein